MRETSKCQAYRQHRGDFDKYLVGSGIDIGCGGDCLVAPRGQVRPWDAPDGDAQEMRGVPDAEYDFVYSSHCLEHMRDVSEVLRNWLRILKPGGHLYFTVPDYILYEKMTWPSPYNSDHKWSFSFVIGRAAVGRPNHIHIEQDLRPLLAGLGAEMLEWRLEDLGFNYNAGMLDQTAERAVAQICVIARKR